jgi:hypothetical protein
MGSIERLHPRQGTGTALPRIAGDLDRGDRQGRQMGFGLEGTDAAHGDNAPHQPDSPRPTARDTGWILSAAAPSPAQDFGLRWLPFTGQVGPLPLFGAAAAFGFSRKLRERIKLAPGALVSGLPLA